ncbi:acetylxylan esterase [Spirosoma pollinicola]|uniref:Acetylxylan esterase n=2 Tax=Spirosoma pollinicola TaxID=2057025 RepID=A0A2K8ZBD1_9BACT|nr:acetylxylan esterase [Spirosoma pollinicola]
MINSFLMIGQSNMAGRGYLSDVKPIYNEQIKMLINGRWQTMTEPINFDRPTAGISLAALFAAAWQADNEQEQIGLIPCAEGGSSLDDWSADGALFEHATFLTKMAQRTSTLRGILWHQGENDSFAGRSNEYLDKLALLVDQLRRLLASPAIPFIAGGLGTYLSSGRYSHYFAEYENVNQALLTFAQETPNCYFVSANGLTANADGLHFDARSQRLFGIRYYDAFQTKRHVLAPLRDEKERVKRLEERPLTKAESTALLEISFARGEISLPELEERLARI